MLDSFGAFCSHFRFLVSLFLQVLPVLVSLLCSILPWVLGCFFLPVCSIGIHRPTFPYAPRLSFSQASVRSLSCSNDSSFSPHTSGRHVVPQKHSWAPDPTVSALAAVRPHLLFMIVFLPLFSSALSLASTSAVRLSPRFYAQLLAHH